MQRHFLMFIAVILLGLLALAASALAQRNSKPDTSEAAEQWEYLIVSGGRTNLSSGSVTRKQPDDSFAQEAIALERNFDKLGTKGWELVSVSGNPNDPVYYFKRLKR